MFPLWKLPASRVDTGQSDKYLKLALVVFLCEQAVHIAEETDLKQEVIGFKTSRVATAGVGGKSFVFVGQLPQTSSEKR